MIVLVPIVLVPSAATAAPWVSPRLGLHVPVEIKRRSRQRPGMMCQNIGMRHVFTDIITPCDWLAKPKLVASAFVTGLSADCWAVVLSEFRKGKTQLNI